MRRARTGASAAWLLAVTLLASGCGGDSSGPSATPPSPKQTVVIADDAYRPSVLRIRVGTRVTWVNRNVDLATVETAGVAFFEYDREKLDRRNRFDLHTLRPGEAESIHFDTPGRYVYYSSYDPNMRGTVIVSEGRNG